MYEKQKRYGFEMKSEKMRNEIVKNAEWNYEKCDMKSR